MFLNPCAFGLSDWALSMGYADGWKNYCMTESDLKRDVHLNEGDFTIARVTKDHM